METVLTGAQDNRQIATAPQKSFVSRFLFGKATFEESEEYTEFQFKFLSVVMLLAPIES